MVSAYESFSPFESSHVSAFVINGSCGDFFCSSLESCSTCSTDCGVCSSTGGGSSGGGGGGSSGFSRGYSQGNFGNASELSYYGLENFWILTKRILEEQLKAGATETLFPRERVLVIYGNKSAYLGVVEIISEDLVLLDLKGAGTEEFNIGDVINFEVVDARLVGISQNGLEVEFKIRKEKKIDYEIVYFILLAILIILIYIHRKEILGLFRRKRKKRRS